MDGFGAALSLTGVVAHDGGFAHRNGSFEMCRFTNVRVCVERLACGAVMICCPPRQKRRLL